MSDISYTVAAARVHDGTVATASVLIERAQNVDKGV